MDQGLIHPYSILHDASTHFGAYSPDNFDKDFLGPIRAKDALILSRNIPAIRLAEQLQHPSLYEFLQKTQITRLRSPEKYGLSLVLGGAEVTMAELASLYATLANDGVWQPLRYEQNQSTHEGIPVLSPEASFLTLDMLRDNVQINGYNSAIYQPIKLAWKTGTSSGYRDAWTIGVVGPYVLAVWIGNFDGKANPAFVGVKKAEPLFLALSQALIAQGKLPVTQQNLRHLHLTQVKVCAGSGMLPTRWCPQVVSTWFIPGKSPIKIDTIYRAVAIDNKTGLRACKFDREVHFEVYEFWPSDLLALFARAGVARKIPPPFMAGCDAFSNSLSQPPRIISPQNSLIYTIAANKTEQSLISLQAQTAADNQKVFWFVNNQLLGETAQSQPLLWSAKSGQYQIRVVDEQGQSDVVHVKVQLK